jgi:hypothetical protein
VRLPSLIWASAIIALIYPFTFGMLFAIFRRNWLFSTTTLEVYWLICATLVSVYFASRKPTYRTRGLAGLISTALRAFPWTGFALALTAMAGFGVFWVYRIVTSRGA